MLVLRPFGWFSFLGEWPVGGDWNPNAEAFVYSLFLSFSPPTAAAAADPPLIQNTDMYNPTIPQPLLLLLNNLKVLITNKLVGDWGSSDVGLYHTHSLTPTFASTLPILTHTLTHSHTLLGGGGVSSGSWDFGLGRSLGREDLL